MKKYIVFTILSILSCTDMNKQYTLNVINSQFKGIIENIYQDEKNHYSYYFDIKIENQSVQKIRAQNFPNSWKYAIIGDSIIKEYGKASIEIIKKTGSRKEFSLCISN